MGAGSEDGDATGDETAVESGMRKFLDILQGVLDEGYNGQIMIENPAPPDRDPILAKIAGPQVGFRLRHTDQRVTRCQTVMRAIRKGDRFAMECLITELDMLVDYEGRSWCIAELN